MCKNKSCEAILFGLWASSNRPQDGSVYLSMFGVNILTPVLVFQTLGAAEVGQWGRLWPPWSSACRWSPAQRWCHAPPQTAPSRSPLIPLSLQHQATSPYSFPPAAHSGCSLLLVLPPHHVGLKITARETHVSCFSFWIQSSYSARVSLVLPFNIPLIDEVFPALSRPTTRSVTFLRQQMHKNIDGLN